MWAMTSFGILMPAARPAHTIARGDDRTMQIRARRAKDLDILRARFMQTSLGPTIHTPSFDYEYRAYCTPHAFAIAMVSMILEIDYLKFKPTTEDRYGDRDLHNCYNRIWSVVLAELSTKHHQWEYWRQPANKTGKHGKKHTTGPASAGSTGGSGSTGSALTTIGTSAGIGVHRDDLTGWPNGRSGNGISSYEDWAADYDWRNGYGPSNAGSGASTGSTDPLPPARRRDTSADRDVYEPDPALEELDRHLRDADAGADVPRATGRPEIDDLYDEIDRLITESERIDHSHCHHAPTDNARSRCRRKRRRQANEQADHLRHQIDALYAREDPVTEGPRLAITSTVEGTVVAELRGSTAAGASAG